MTSWNRQSFINHVTEKSCLSIHLFPAVQYRIVYTVTCWNRQSIINHVTEKPRHWTSLIGEWVAYLGSFLTKIHNGILAQDAINNQKYNLKSNS